MLTRVLSRESGMKGENGIRISSLSARDEGMRSRGSAGGSFAENAAVADIPRSRLAKLVIFSVLLFVMVSVSASASICLGSLPAKLWALEGKCWNAGELAESIDEKWASLSEEQRIEALQALADYEAVSLSLPFRPYVTAGSLPHGTLGQCSWCCITVDESSLMKRDGGWLMARVVEHEVYHCFQHAVVWGLYDETGSRPECFPDGQAIEQWRREMFDYQDSPSGYWVQKIEVSARSYADDALTRLRDEAYEEDGYECIYSAKVDGVLV